MAARRLRVTLRPDVDRAPLEPAFDRLREENGVPAQFPPPVLAAAEEAARTPRLPAYDATDVPFVTVDPPGSTDLDQALHLQRDRAGYRVRYAIADVAAFVRAGDPVDVEAHGRGETVYAPDGRTPLHPPVLSEGAASLLAGQDRPALLWDLRLDGDGELRSVDLRRALVRSREQLSYEQVQASLEADAAPEWARLLDEVGRHRERVEAERGGVSLPIPQQEVVRADGGGYALAHRTPLPVERWNAQVSLLTGLAAARLLLDAGVGVLRTLPPATDDALAALRRVAAGLGVTWPPEEAYPDLVRRLDPDVPAHAALLQEATGLLRGAGYTALDGVPAPERVPDLVHGALAAPYAHVTAPLRRLVDRFGLEVCAATCAGAEVPAWVRQALPVLPAEMAASSRRTGAVERGAVDLVEAAVLRDDVGREYDAVVVDVSSTGGTVVLQEPAVRGRCDGADLPLGERLRVRLVEASVEDRRVRFVPA